MKKVTVTRMALLARKEQIGLARQGLDLLTQKRAALLQELMRTADFVLTQQDALQETAAAARRALARAEAIAGPEAVRSAAMAARGEFSLEMQTTNIMGVRVPTIEKRPAARSVLGRGYAISGQSATIDETAAAYEAAVEQLIELAESELRLQRLAQEIQRTTRRTNALEHIILPRLEGERDMIELALDERERAEHFRLKRVKQSRHR